ncbi:MAG: class I SAM-dependent methyltransferase [Acidobacteria bacterium]|nr:class I SAM-dependent methyltransferase [Acidobacteriota bacterium]
MSLFPNVRQGETATPNWSAGPVASTKPPAERPLPLGPPVQKLLVCPCCGAALRGEDFSLVCTESGCSTVFPVIGGIPILINEHTSMFRIASYRQQASPAALRYLALKTLAKKLLPGLGGNLAARRNFRRFGALLLIANPRPNVLVVGGAQVGAGMAEFLRDSRIEFVETDICFGPRTRLVCDARDLPFADNSFDGVVIQAVLEYVADPERCVEEIYRVLKSEGIVYSEAPFMQQVHARSDFTRFTALGHRRLYRRFAEISSGVTGGPGMALAWSLRHFLLSFVDSRWARDSVKVLTSCLFFWLKYFDLFLAHTRSGRDAACGTYFLGRKSPQTLADRELLGLYQGAITGEGIL